MQLLQDHSRFLQLLVAVLVLYGFYVWFTGRDPDRLAVGLVALGTAAFLFVAYRCQEDFAPESER